MPIRLSELLSPASALFMVTPHDSLTKALHSIQSFPSFPLPVVREGILVGMISLSELAPNRELRFDHARVVTLMRPVEAVGYPWDDPAAAWETMATHGLTLLPVVDEGGRFLGVVHQSDLLAALKRELRPARVGGMATIGGVHLTTGHLRAGPGDLALLLTGMLFAAVAWMVLLGFSALSLWVPIKAWGQLVFVLAFLLFLRSSPLAGHHAAEHQTVHAIERGEALTLEVVKLQPREHPRCGTNLMALLLGMSALLPWMQKPLVFFSGLLFLLFTWRPMGMWLQHVFTTKPASDEQLLKALATGRQLLERYQDQPSFRAPVWARIWMMGIIQITLGAAFMEALIRLCGRIL